MMNFGDLKTRAAQQELNNFLAERSYIEGYEPSQLDAQVFEAISAAPPSDLFNALRFYNHIKSFTDAERKAFRGADAAAAATTAAAKPAKADDDDFDLFGEDEEEDEAIAKRNAERVAAYQAKKANKPALIAKSSVLLDCKPWDDETDMKAFEDAVRSIQMDGLVWGQSKLIPVAYGLKKLQIGCVIEDDKVSTEALEEQICAFEDYCQSVDIAAFNKI